MLTEMIKLYEDRNDVTLTTYVIAEKGELHAQGKRPAVLICPGGAYMNCSDREAEPVALKFASMGVSCICASLFGLWRGRRLLSGSVKTAGVKSALSVSESDV